MKKKSLIVMLAFLIAFPLFSYTASVPTAQAYAIESLAFYVSTDGSDSNNGGKLDPFASLERARQAIRAVKADSGLPEGGITVYLRTGTYERSETFTLSAQDSGVAGSEVVYRAYPGEEVRLVGGVELDPADFGAVTDPLIAARLPAGGSGVLQYDLNALGGMNYGQIFQYGFGMAWLTPPPELFVGDTAMVTARWPNDDFVTVGTLDDPGSNPREGDLSNRGATFAYTDERPESWGDLSDVWMYGYWFHDWADGNLKIDSLNPTTNRIQTAQPSFYSVKSGQRYYYYNIIEELDVEGEWYLDRNSGVLYVRPTAGFASSHVVLSQLTTPMATLNNTSHVVLQDLIFEGSRGTGVRVIGGSDNLIKGATFRNLADFAVKVEGGQRHGVVESKIYNTGIGGILLNGGQRATLTSAGHYVVDNEMFNYSRLKSTYSPAVDIFGVGNRVAHNLIYDAPHMAIRIQGNEHVVEYNEIHDVLKETSDAGAIYMGRNWSEQANVIRYNYMYNLQGVNQGVGQMGVYLDDLASGTIVYGNIIQNADRGMLIGGGRSHTIANNMIIDSDASVTFDARGLAGWAHTCSPGGVMITNLQAVPYDTEPWASRYPELVGILDDQPCQPLYNHVANNVMYRTPVMSINAAVTAGGTVENNLTTATDPGFTDLSGGDLSLLDNAPIFSELPGFAEIPFAMIGIRTSAERLQQLDDALQLHIASSDVQPPLAGLLNTAIGEMTWAQNHDKPEKMLQHAEQFLSHVHDPAYATAISTEGKTALTAAVQSLIGKLGEDHTAAVNLILPRTYLTPGEEIQMIASSDNWSGQYVSLLQAADYSSSNPAVASVASNGRIHALTVGQTVITVTVGSGAETVSASVNVEVVPAFLDTLTMTIADELLSVGDTTSLHISGQLSNSDPADLSGATIVLHSSTPEVATVDALQQVEALEPGYTVIGATVTLSGVTRTASVLAAVYDPLGGGGLPASWQLTAYGGAQGIATEEDGKFVMVSNGANIWGTADSFTYAAQELDALTASSPVTIEVAVESLLNTNQDASAGLMFRDSSLDGAKHVNVRVRPDGAIRFVYRNADNGVSQYAAAQAVPFPARIRLTMDGDLFTAYVERSGVWQQVTQTTVDMDGAVWAGLTLFSLSEQYTAATLSDWSLTTGTP